MLGKEEMRLALSYERKFVFLSPEDKGYESTIGKIPKGHIEIERKKDKLNFKVFVENLKEMEYQIQLFDSQDHCVILGYLSVGDNGKGQGEYHTNSGNVMGCGKHWDEFDIIVIRPIGKEHSRKTPLVAWLKGTKRQIPLPRQEEGMSPQLEPIDQESSEEPLPTSEKSIEESKVDEEKKMEQIVPEEQKEILEEEIVESVQQEQGVVEEEKGLEERLGQSEQDWQVPELSQISNSPKELEPMEEETLEEETMEEEPVAEETLEEEPVQEEITQEPFQEKQEFENLPIGFYPVEPPEAPYEQETKSIDGEASLEEEEYLIDFNRDLNESLEDELYEEYQEKDQKVNLESPYYYINENLDRIQNTFTQCIPFDPPLKNYKWWKITGQEESLEQFYLFFNGSFVPLTYPYMEYRNIGDIFIKKYNHRLFGMVFDEEYHKDRPRYYVYGIPGRLCIQDQPFQGNTGYLYWHPAKYYKNQKGSMGYWLLYVDTQTGALAVPKRPTIPPIL